MADAKHLSFTHSIDTGEEIQAYYIGNVSRGVNVMEVTQYTKKQYQGKNKRK